MSSYDLSKLTEFDPALVYQFEPEVGRKRAMGSQNRIHDLLYVSVGQHIDVLNAYLYAQDTILPTIRYRGIRNIPPDQWETWICKIHEIIAKTLFQSYNTTPGEYSKSPVFRWHDGAEVYTHIQGWFAPPMYRLLLPTTVEGVAKEIIKSKESSTSTTESDYVNFLNLCDKIGSRKDVVFTELQNTYLQRIPASLKRGNEVFCKLQTVYHTKQLSEREKQIVDKIGIISLPYKRTKEKMKGLTEYFVETILEFNKAKLEKVVKLAANMFSRFNLIHPFANCNGRTITCFTNVYLRAAGLPSIVLRLDGEKYKKGGLYHSAMQIYGKENQKLEELIMLRLKQSAGNNFENKFQKLLIEKRVSLAQICQQIEKTNPSIDLLKYYDKFESEVQSECNVRIVDTETGKLEETPQYLLESFDALLKKLSDWNESLKPESERALNWLQSITETYSGWKYYAKHSTALLTLEDEERITQVAEILKNTGACNVTVTRLAKDKSKHVCKVTKIDLPKG